MASDAAEQREGQEHVFLDYKTATVYFVYTFSWDLGSSTFKHLRDKLESPHGLWVQRLLHERSMWPADPVAPAYQPNLVTRSAVLEYSEEIGSIAVIVPTASHRGIKLAAREKFRVQLSYTARIFDNGSGTCTFAARLLEAELPDPTTSFTRIHHVLHLAHNVDHGRDDDWDRVHLTNSYISVPKRGQPKHTLFPTSKQESHSFTGGYCSLHDLFRKFLLSAPWITTTDDSNTDVQVLFVESNRQDFQTPFVFTVACVEPNAFLRFRSEPSPHRAKEVGSILCKLTMDNRHVTTEYLNLNDDYLSRVLPFNRERNELANLCLDRRLFFTFNRRGAIAITSSLDDIPSSFVIPSLLNLCELLRARWYLANIVNIRLDRAIADACSGERFGADILNEMFHWRAMFANFYRDPVPFLFDGGSVTELAEIADRELWLKKLSGETTRKFALLDRIVQDLYERKDIRDLMK
jgi:hypothetical protein